MAPEVALHVSTILLNEKTQLPDLNVISALLIETCFARIVQEAWILPMRHTRHGIDYGPQLGGVSLARCGWMDFRKLWLRP